MSQDAYKEWLKQQPKPRLEVRIKRGTQDTVMFLAWAALGLGVLLPILQVGFWLKTGIWTPITIAEAIMPFYPTDWIGFNQVLLWVATLPASGVLAGLGAVLITSVAALV
ncbi:hypothetical protein [Microvirga sp. TS319]|uniref:hypothetical protein n=1 Tax=Microvirga sp. TS319 TaxID=3241165 RepID=UPI00351A3C3B